MRIVAGRSFWSSADSNLEIAVHVELDYEAVPAFLIRRPRRASSIWRRGISRDPDIVVLVDINAMLIAWPNAARFRLTFTADETGVGRTAPGTQQLAVG